VDYKSAGEWGREEEGEKEGGKNRKEKREESKEHNKRILFSSNLFQKIYHDSYYQKSTHQVIDNAGLEFPCEFKKQYQ
jgi:hypothetical protein